MFPRQFGTGAAGSASCCAGVKCVPRDKLSCSLNEQVLPYGECCYECLGETGYRYGHCDMLPNTAIPLDQQTPIAGYVDVRQKLSGGKIEVRMQVLGFDSKSRSYGITVLQYGDLSRGCLSAGDHYNPFNYTHGGPKDQIRYLTGGKVEVFLRLKGFARNLRSYGVTVHELGDQSKGCTSTLDHYNPFNLNHGGPKDEIRHLGDWGNVEADSTGEVNAIIKDEVASLVGPYSIIGRTIVIHANEDDLGRGDSPETKKTGNVGKRLACCVLGHSDGTHWKDLEKLRKRKREAVRVEGPSAQRVVRSPRRN
ncbi:Superoxide dismutase [Cu-Zn] [Branchiostoma belcheri]|nr:Superoxide dismutase [Cu-Zn] [Branchiostoma belcheri]